VADHIKTGSGHKSGVKMLLEKIPPRLPRLFMNQPLSEFATFYSGTYPPNILRFIAGCQQCGSFRPKKPWSPRPEDYIDAYRLTPWRELHVGGHEERQRLGSTSRF